jgi:cytoskeletal protein RodZ
MTANGSSGGFGAKLRDARERRGVSLRQIANTTKISISALEALERNDVSRLPGGIFSRAFVRSYAVEVGLDPDIAIQEFIAQFPADSTSAHSAVDHVEDAISVENERRMAGTVLSLVLISLPIAGAILYYAVVGRGAPKPDAPPVAAAAPAPDLNRAAETPPAPTSPDPPPPAAAALPASLPTAAASAATADTPPAAAASASTDATSEPRGESVTVTLSVKRPCWVSAAVDGERRIERLMQPGEQQTIEVKRELVLTAGDASAIALAFNGAAARPLGKAGEVVTARFNLNNYKDYVLQSR